MVGELERLPHNVLELAAVVLQKLRLTVSGLVSWVDLLESLERVFQKYNQGTACVYNVCMYNVFIHCSQAMFIPM